MHPKKESQMSNIEVIQKLLNEKADIQAQISVSDNWQRKTKLLVFYEVRQASAEFTRMDICRERKASVASY